jgi:hypothetical protein
MSQTNTATNSHNSRHQLHGDQLPSRTGYRAHTYPRFLLLVRPREYAYTTNEDASPFRLCDIHLLLNNHLLHPYSCSEEDLHVATYVALEFTMQKNGVRGELVGLGRSGHHFLCPVIAMIGHIRHLRLHAAQPTTPIFSVYTHTGRQAIQIMTLMQHLRQAVLPSPHHVGITTADTPFAPYAPVVPWPCYVQR